ncbi:vomeronasal type-2 receptor 26-like isoform X2 [Hyperolius riggenbachi]|uniref:vomeronasal type-2 receptor 26-like isoform X2 n=1 Tax=Hyperolius riggenbachi TaxID=752182 RepID=UPI0035A34A9B
MGYTSNKKFVCSEDCLPGYRKINRGEPICCFSCIPCSIGEISNLTDMKNCISCPDDEWPDEKKSNCIKKHINFLSYKDYLGLAIEILSVFFFTVTLVVLVIFIIYRDTPIVKANNRILSYIILVNLQMSFLCPFLYIGQPTMITCAMRQVAFSMFFTAVISSVIAKTLIVLLAFHSTTPGSWLRSWTGKQTSVYIVLFCSSIEVIICMWSLIWNTPYPFKDTKSEMETIILTCDDGSGIAFYVIHGYILFLAMFSFVLAFLVRKLPDRFNEAHYITFSMLVFCSVWIAFIPTYLSIKGKYLVAVEVFAIMASSAGLLCCIFFSKCYKVLINHQINSKIQLFKVPQSKNI